MSEKTQKNIAIIEEKIFGLSRDLYAHLQSPEKLQSVSAAIESLSVAYKTLLEAEVIESERSGKH